MSSKYTKEGSLRRRQLTSRRTLLASGVFCGAEDPFGRFQSNWDIVCNLLPRWEGKNRHQRKPGKHCRKVGLDPAKLEKLA